MSRDRSIAPKGLVDGSFIYHSTSRLPYMAAYRGRGRILKEMDGDKGASFQLLPNESSGQRRQIIAPMHTTCAPQSGYSLEATA